MVTFPNRARCHCVLSECRRFVPPGPMTTAKGKATTPISMASSNYAPSQAGGHGIQTGQRCEITTQDGSCGITIPATIRGNVATFGGVNTMPTFVTGPDTLAARRGLARRPDPAFSDTVNSHTEIPVVLNAYFGCPDGCGGTSISPRSDQSASRGGPASQRAQLGTTQHDMTGYHYRLDGYTAGTKLQADLRRAVRDEQ